MMNRVVLFLFVGVLISCGMMDSGGKKLEGKWKMSSWTIDKSGEAVQGTMDFQFAKDGHYTVDYGTQKEQGVYEVQGDRLYTTETGQARKYVKIIQCTADTLVIGMNRGGQLETVVLLKESE